MSKGKRSLETAAAMVESKYSPKPVGTKGPAVPPAQPDESMPQGRRKGLSNPAVKLEGQSDEGSEAGEFEAPTYAKKKPKYSAAHAEQSKNSPTGGEKAAALGKAAKK